MRQPSRTAWYRLCLGGLVAACSACGGASDTPQAEQATRPGDSALEREVELVPGGESPLERAVGGIDSLVDMRRRAIAAKEDLVAECMESRGWTYTPNVPSAASIRYDHMVNKYQVLIADDESRERWGYGIATRFDANGEPYPYDGALLVEDPSFVEITESRDTGGLTEAEHRQRTLDLAGEQLGSPSLDAEPCLAVADNQFVETYPAFAALGVLEEELGKQTASSPEFEGAREQWVKCMADAGFAVEDVHNPAGDLDMRVNSLAAAGKLSVDDLAPLVSEELVMASTDWECRRDSLTAEYDRIRHLVESDFLERAPELLSDLRDEGP